MNQNSSHRNILTLASILSLAVLIKLLWVAVSYLFLPTKGIDITSGQVKNSLHYRYKLASNKVQVVKKPKRTIRRPSAPSMKNMVLSGIYIDQERCIITILKKTKSYVLTNGDNIDGFVLQDATAKEAYFTKNDKEYMLRLQDKKSKGKSSISIASNNQETISKKDDNSISVESGIRKIPKSMIETYSKDINRAMRDIGLWPTKKSGKMIGFKVKFIKQSSPFAKLGLEKGDIIRSINGEEIVDLKGPMNLLRNAGTLEGLTITILRGNEEKELEYEVK